MVAGYLSSTAPPPFAFRASSQPMFYAALAFASGIVFAKYQWRPALWWWVAAIVLVVSAAALARKRAGVAIVAALSVLFVSGALIADYDRLQSSVPVDARPYVGRPVEITGNVIRAGLIRHRDRDEVQTFDLQNESIAGQPLAMGLRVNAYRIERD